MSRGFAQSLLTASYCVSLARWPSRSPDAVSEICSQEWCRWRSRQRQCDSVLIETQRPCCFNLGQMTNTSNARMSTIFIIAKWRTCTQVGATPAAALFRWYRTGTAPVPTSISLSANTPFFRSFRMEDIGCKVLDPVLVTSGKVTRVTLMDLVPQEHPGGAMMCNVWRTWLQIPKSSCQGSNAKPVKENQSRRLMITTVYH